MPVFTVLIAIHNAAPWLDACLDSLAAQTLPDFEAFCVDDCSTDGSPAIIARRCAADRRFIALRTAVNSGQAVARNLGLRQARGTYTLFVDADDWLAPDALERLAADLCATPAADAAVFTVMTVDGAGRQEELPTVATARVMTGHEAALLSVDWRLHGVYALRTSLHRRLPYATDLRRYADDNTTCLHYLACRRVVRSRAVYFYRQHGQSCTHGNLLSRLDLLAANALRRRMLEDAAIGREGLRRCEAYCWYNFVALYREFQLAAPALPPSARRQAHRRFAAALAAMRPLRLPLSVVRHPSTLFVRPYALFRRWQALLLACRRQGR